MNGIRHARTLLQTYAQRMNLSVSTVGKYAIGADDLEKRLPEGRITIARVDRLIQWFSDHWPCDLAWPSEIPRPCPSLGSPADGEAA